MKDKSTFLKMGLSTLYVILWLAHGYSNLLLLLEIIYCSFTLIDISQLVVVSSD